MLFESTLSVRQKFDGHFRGKKSSSGNSDGTIVYRCALMLSKPVSYAMHFSPRAYLNATLLQRHPHVLRKAA